MECYCFCEMSSLETIIDMQSWCKTWLLNGSSRIRAKQKLLRKRTRACKSSWSRIVNQKSFTLTVPWNLAKPVKIFPGIVVRQHHTDRKEMGFLREQCAELRKGLVQYCCSQVWMKNGGRIPWNVTAICKTFKITCLMGRHLMKDVSEYHFWPGYSVWSNGRNHPISAQDLSRLHQFGPKALPRCFFGCVLYAGVWKGDILVADIEELEEMDASEVHAKEQHSIQRKC